MKYILRLKDSFFVFFFFSFIFTHYSNAKTIAPGIDEVLKNPKFSLNMKFIIISFFVVLFTIIASVKTYKIFKSRQNPSKVNIPVKEDPQLDNLKSEIVFMSAELKKSNEENVRLNIENQKLEDVVKQRIENEEILRRTVSSLKREYEKVLQEKERVALELNKYTGFSLFKEETKKPNPVIEKQSAETIVAVKPMKNSAASQNGRNKLRAVPKKRVLVKEKTLQML